jgi:hypothetical protein
VGLGLYFGSVHALCLQNENNPFLPGAQVLSTRANTLRTQEEQAAEKRPALVASATTYYHEPKPNKATRNLEAGLSPGSSKAPVHTLLSQGPHEMLKVKT